MKSTFFRALLILVSQAALAEVKYGMAGCGLGAVVFQDRAPIFAATTNDLATAGFAISSGTSNCQEDPHAAAVKVQQKFFNDNLQVLSKQMAQGDGTYVRTLATTMGCGTQAQGEFCAQMQRSYSDIFSSPGSSAMLNRVRTLIQENKQLKTNCHDAII